MGLLEDFHPLWWWRWACQKTSIPCGGGGGPVRRLPSPWPLLCSDWPSPVVGCGPLQVGGRPAGRNQASGPIRGKKMKKRELGGVTLLPLHNPLLSCSV